MPLLLPLGLPVYLHESLPSVMEPGSRGVARARSDCLPRRPDCSQYTCNRISTAPTRTLSHRLQQMEAVTPRCPDSWSSNSPTLPHWGREECWITGHSEEDCGIAPPRQTGPENASATHDDAVHTPNDACPTAMPGVACYALPTSGATAKEVCREGSHC